MIIWGFKVIYKMLSQGTFLCPKEGGDRPYAIKMARRWFHVFFIPIIPLKEIGAVVECQSCRTKYQETVLQQPTIAQQGNSLVDASRGAVVSVLRSGDHDAMAREQALRMLSAYVPGYSESALTTDMAQLDVSQLRGQLNSLSGFLDSHGKEGFMSRLALVGIGGSGALSPAARNVLEHVGSDMGMTAAHCRGTIDSVVDQATKRA
jgi:hypothetical protein